MAHVFLLWAPSAVSSDPGWSSYEEGGAFLGKQPLELVAIYMSGLHIAANFILEFPQNSQVHATSYS